MQSLIVDSIGSLVLDRLIKQIVLETEYFSLEVKSEILKLRDTIFRLKQTTPTDGEHDSSVLEYLRDLKDVFNDADDLLYHISAEKSRREKLAGGSIGRKVSHFCSLSNPIVSHRMIAIDIRSINRNLRKLEIAADRDGIYSANRGFIGRHKEKIMEILTQPTKGEDVLVLPIVGVGGVGKSTLAMSVYTDNRVVMQFEKKSWVLVQEKMTHDELVRQIIESLSYERVQESMDKLEDLLVNLVKGKKHFLVLDDACDMGGDSWMTLKRLLVNMGNGSRILVTTRRYDIAQIMGTVPPFELESGDVTDWNHRIVVRDSKIWGGSENPNLSVLKSSYDSLNSDSRQCFKRCSFFPKDYEFDRFEVIQFWETFDLADSKYDHLKDLLSCSLLQECKGEHFDMKFKMHDQLHDKARYFMLDEFVIVTRNEKINRRIRHLLFIPSELSREDALWLLENTGSIRTITSFNKIEQSVVESFIHRCRLLRVIILRKSGLKAFPRGIGGLKLLQYLDLTGNDGFEEIPNSICMLQNLKTFLLEGCTDVRELPKDTRNLIDLTMLSITTKQRFLPENGIGCLTSLIFLAITGCQNLKYLPQGIHLLKSLTTLIIKDCKSLIKLPRSIIYLVGLETLVIANCKELQLNRKVELEGEGNYYEGYLNDATGLSLRRCWLASLPQLLDLPKWLVKKSATTLRCLHIEDCQSFKVIPDWFEELNKLEDLEILNCSNLSHPHGNTHFSAIDKVKIEGCPHLTQHIIPTQSASDSQVTKSSIRGVQGGNGRMEKGKGVLVEKAVEPTTSSMHGVGPSSISSAKNSVKVSRSRSI